VSTGLNAASAGYADAVPPSGKERPEMTLPEDVVLRAIVAERRVVEWLLDA
jgi:hypothetical protein